MVALAPWKPRPRLSDSLVHSDLLVNARVTQIMKLRNLALDIQEEILFPPRTTHGRDLICERHLRPIAAVLDWRKQRRMWSNLLEDSHRAVV